MTNQMAKAWKAIHRAGEALLRNFGRVAQTTTADTQKLVVLYRRTSTATRNEETIARSRMPLVLRLGWSRDRILVVDESDTSGSSNGRPGLDRTLRLMAAGEVEALIVDDITRISRDPRELDEFYAIARAAGVYVRTSTSS